jgi:hypothetical protein
MAKDQARKKVGKEFLKHEAALCINRERFPPAVASLPVFGFNDASIRVWSDHFGSDNEPCVRVNIQRPSEGAG